MLRSLAVGGVILAVAAVALGTIHVTRPAWYERWRYPLKYDEIVRGHARNYHLEPSLLAAVIYQESKFDPNAHSSSGAIGLMQLLPSTALGIAARTGGTQFRVDDLYDPELNVRYGAWYLRHLIDKYDDRGLALAAYNAGQRNVDRWVAHGERIEFAETRKYVERVQELAEIYARIYGSRLKPSKTSMRHLTDSEVMS